MSDASSSSGCGGGHHTSASPSTSTHTSPASFDGGHLLRLLQNPPGHLREETLGAPSVAPGPHHFFSDPAVAAVGPPFAASAQAQAQGRELGWSSTSATHVQQQPQFSDTRFARGEPFAALAGRGFGSGDALRAERPRPGAPPPGFDKPSHPPPAASGVVLSREQYNPSPALADVRHAIGRMPHGHGEHLSMPITGGRDASMPITSGRDASMPITGGRDASMPITGGHDADVRHAIGRMPHGHGEQLSMPITGGRDADVRHAIGRMPHGHGEQLPMQITGGRDAAVGMIYREHQQDRFLSRTPPEINANGPFGRMRLGEQHTLPILGGRMPPVQEGRAPHSAHGLHESCLTNPLQREQRWQGLTEDKGYASQKAPNVNAHYTFGKAPVKELHHVTIPAGSSVPAEIMENQASGLDGGRIGKVALEHGINGKVVVEASKFELSYEKGKIRFAGHDEQDDGEDAIIEQMTQNLVIDGNDDGKGVVLEKTIQRSKDFRSDFSRGHHVSSQKIRFQRRNRLCRYDIDQFTPNFLSIFESLVPSEEEIAKQKQLLTSLSRLINAEWPNSKLYLYGSCANYFGFSNSDIDLCLSIDDKELSKVDIILKLADILQAGNLQNIQPLTRARVPIVKFMDPETGLSCDICVNNLLAVVNTKLLRDYAQIDRRLRQLAFIVKHWAKVRRLNETYQGTLSSYAYVIMCIHLLQLRRILPCLQEMEATYYVKVDENNCAYFDQVDKLNNYGAHNRDTVSRLLWAFFHYWAYEHDYTRDVISIRTGRIISKERKDWTRRVGNDRHLICIEDPFEISHDLGRVVDKFTIKILREEFERAANILQFDPNPCITLFEPYVPPPLLSLLQEDTANATEIGR